MFYGRKRENIEYALLHIIEDLTNKELTSDSLEKELYGVLHQRDEVQHDALDEVVETVGDALLVRIARILNESVRESDVLARYGGEEFVVLATGTDLDGALFLAEKIRTAVAETVYPLQDSDLTVRLTISIGVAAFAGDRRHFFHEADRALYRAKADGKNCVVAASS